MDPGSIGTLRRVSLNHLLPKAGTAPRCADFAASIAVDPGGTAIRADLVLLVELILPWAKPVGSHEEIANVVAHSRTVELSVKVLACEPGRSPASDPDVTTVHAFRRTQNGSAERCTYRLSRESHLDGLDKILGGAADDLAVSVHEGPALLVCTQGSHDVCCGERGHTLADRAEERFPKLDVFRVSHTGGHRFAPTALTFPDGRMWAYLTLDNLGSIFEHSGAPADLAGQCRGWWGAPVGPGQVGERAVFAAEPWSFENEQREIMVHPPVDGIWNVDIETAVRRWRVEVEVAREVPTIACSADGGLPAKPGREYRVRSLRSC